MPPEFEVVAHQSQSGGQLGATEIPIKDEDWDFDTIEVQVYRSPIQA